MSHFSVNGVAKDLPVSAGDSFETLIRYLRHSYVTEASVISEVRVNGVEINILDEEALAQVPLHELNSVEVITSHPREVAQETLQSLLNFTQILSNLSFHAADRVHGESFNDDFARLIEGISTLTEGISYSRQIMRVGVLPAVNVLEADLLSILKDVLHAQQTDQKDFLVQLLREHLPENLEAWKNEGIPALIRSRDS